MVEQIEEALQNFTKNPTMQGRILRAMLEENPKKFSSGALQALLKNGDARGHKYLITLLLQNSFLIEDLYDPEVFTKEVSISLAQKMAQVEPQLDSRLARLLPGRGDGSPEVQGKAAERVLDLVEAISSSARIVPLITHLTVSPDSRLRSRAVLMIGKRGQNARPTEAILNEPDARVRASAVEALWGIDSAAVRAILWQAVKDPYNRVAGNAIYGLYCLADQEVTPYLLKMSADSRPLHRATAAWVMGKTRDARFLPPLEGLTSDLYAVVRRNAASAIARIQATEESAAKLPVSP